MTDSILNLGTRYEWSASHSGHFISVIHWIGCWVDPRAILDMGTGWQRQKIPSLGIRTLVIWPVAQ